MNKAIYGKEIAPRFYQDIKKSLLSNKNCVLKLFLLAGVILFFATLSAQPLPIDGNGIQLRNFYLNLDVTHLWQAYYQINWETGEITGKRNTTTHCTKFAAGACKRRGIYILRPGGPTYSANTVYDWLQTKEAKKTGWIMIIADDLSLIWLFMEID